MLDTRFPRIEGDIGNPASFDFPVIFRTMQGIGSADAVAAASRTGRACWRRLSRTRETLAAAGAVGMSTSCGFLALLPERARAALAGAGRDLGAAADQDAHTEQEGRRDHRLGEESHARAFRGRRRTRGHAGRRHARRRIVRCDVFAQWHDARPRRRRSAKPSRRVAHCCRSIQMSMPSCSNAPTCRLIRRRCRRPWRAEVHDVLDLLRDFRRRLG